MALLLEGHHNMLENMYLLLSFQGCVPLPLDKTLWKGHFELIEQFQCALVNFLGVCLSLFRETYFLFRKSMERIMRNRAAAAIKNYQYQQLTKLFYASLGLGLPEPKIFVSYSMPFRGSYLPYFVQNVQALQRCRSQDLSESGIEKIWVMELKDI